MKKYDCTKSLDYSHELKRLCTYGKPNFGCLNFECPLRDKGCFLITAETVALLQKWSDEHPEMPKPTKLTKREHDFLATFLISANKAISRGKNINDLYIHDVISGKYFCIDPTMFFFIREGEQMTFDDLLKLEVEE